MMADIHFPEILFTALIGAFMVALLVLSFREEALRARGR